MANKPPKNEKVPMRHLIDRKWWIVGILVVVFGAFMVRAYWMMGAKSIENISEKVNVSGVTDSTEVTNVIPDVNSPKPSPGVVKLIEEDNQIASKRAEESGESHYAYPVMDLLPEPEPKPEPKPKLPPSPQPPIVTEFPSQQIMETYLSKRMGIWDQMPGHGTMVINVETNSPDVQMVSAGSNKEGSNTKNEVPDELKKLIPGNLLYISTDVAVNSDVSIPPVTGTVVYSDDPRLIGTRLVGAYRRINDILLVEYTSITLKNNKTYSIKGYAMDARTKILAVASDVDHHYFSRWGGLLTGALLEGASDAVKEGGQRQTTISPSGSTTNVFRDLNTDEQIAVALGTVGSRVSGILMNNFNRPPTVTLDPDILVAVMIFNVGN